MGILGRFKDIMASNINATLDKMEDPSKMVDQYLINMRKDLATVKKETAGVMAEETRSKRLIAENNKEVDRYNKLAEKAVMAGNDDDARVFLSKTQELESIGAGLTQAYAVAKENADKMRAMHDKLVKDIQELDARKNMIKAKAAGAKTRETVNKAMSNNAKRGGADAFNRLEERVNRRLDAAEAMAELNEGPTDSAKDLASKYNSGASSTNVDSALEAMKARLAQQNQPSQ